MRHFPDSRPLAGCGQHRKRTGDRPLPLEERLDVLQDTAGKFMHMELSISMGNAVSYRDIYREVSELEKLLDSTMNRRGRILYKDQTLPRGTTCTQSEIRLWETLLQSADKEALKKACIPFCSPKPRFSHRKICRKSVRILPRWCTAF
ncbi:hypothetical protein LC724_10880 [Blautia sp. RD014234]|nr:hypothetical protein [Blautia parvula]